MGCSLSASRRQAGCSTGRVPSVRRDRRPQRNHVGEQRSHAMRERRLSGGASKDLSLEPKWLPRLSQNGYGLRQNGYGHLLLALLFVVFRLPYILLISDC